MQQEPEIAFRGVESSDVVEAKIRERIERLERYVDDIISCRVVVDTPHRHKKKGKIYQVAIDISVPGDLIVVNRNPEDDHSHEDVYVSIRDAFSAAERQLKEYAERRRGQTKAKSSSAGAEGTVSRLFPAEGYGFITPNEGGAHVYFHENAVVDGSIDDMEVDTPVRYHEEPGEEGPQASSVHILSEQERVPGT